MKIIPKVIEYLKAKYPKFNFRFALTINKKELKQLNKEIEKHILFLGKVNINQCPFSYKQADFMFLPILLGMLSWEIIVVYCK